MLGEQTPSEPVFAMADVSPSPALEFENLSGALIDERYRVLRVLGAGGIGLVYLCQHELLGKPVAMKVLRPEYVSHPNLNERFMIEARAASSIKSRHVVETIDIGTLPNGAPYFVMDYVEGETLAALLDREPMLSVRRTLEISRQIVKGLAAAHAAGVVHRDLKPENVFLSPQADGSLCVKLFDFGIAKVAGQRKRLTYVGAVFGTPTYMSPEQAKGDTVDERADLYALGVMMFEMLAGGVPFDGEDPLSIMAQHVEKAPPALESLYGAMVPSALEAIIRRCLEKSPADRYPNAAALLAELDTVDPDGPAAVHAPLTPKPGERTPLTLQPHIVAGDVPVKKRRGSLLGVGVALGVFVLGTGIAAVRGGSSRARAGGARVDAAPQALSPTPRRAERVGETLPAPEAPGHEPPPAVERTVHFVLSPLDAKVYRGEREIGQMPVSLSVKPGESVTVSVRRKGYATRRIVVDGSESRVVVGLVKLGEPAPDARRAVNRPVSRADSSKRAPSRPASQSKR